MLDKLHPRIRGAFYIFMFVLIASLTAVFISDAYRQEAYDRQLSENRAMRIWKNKIDGSRASNRIIDEYESSYTQLVKNSVVGDENRLSWFETIQATSNARGMPSVKYNVSSQKMLQDKTGVHAQQGINVYRSKMTLDIEMSHEGDLFAMLNSLEQKARGLFSVDSCSIEKKDVGPKAQRPNIRALCELSWFTFRSADQGGNS